MAERNLTRKQENFVKAYIETGVGSEAARQAYDIEPSNTHLAAVIASENLTIPDIKQKIDEALSDERLNKKHNQLLEASTLEKLSFDEHDEDEEIREVVAQIEGYTLLHIVTRLDKEGNPTSKYAYVKAPDNQTQEKALDKAYKVRGLYAPDKSITVNVDVDSSEDIKSLAARLNAMERGTGVTGDGAISSPVGEEAQNQD